MPCEFGIVPGYEDETSVLIYRDCFYWSSCMNEQGDCSGWKTTSIPDHWYTPPKTPEQLAAMAMTKAVNAAQMAEAEARNQILMEKMTADLKAQEEAAKADKGMTTADAIRKWFIDLSESVKQPLPGSYWVKYKWIIDNWQIILTVIGIGLTIYGIWFSKSSKRRSKTWL